MCLHVTTRPEEPAEPGRGGGEGQAYAGGSLPMPGGEGSGEEVEPFSVWGSNHMRFPGIGRGPQQPWKEDGCAL